jgi:hypothetical protein
MNKSATKLPPNSIPLVSTSITILEQFTSCGSYIGKIDITNDKRVALRIVQYVDGSRIEVLRITMAASVAKVIGSHLDEAAWHLDPKRVACECPMHIAAPATTVRSAPSPRPMIELFDYLEQQGVNVPAESRDRAAEKFDEIARKLGYAPATN